MADPNRTQQTDTPGSTQTPTDRNRRGGRSNEPDDSRDAPTTGTGGDPTDPNQSGEQEQELPPGRTVSGGKTFRQ